MTERARSTLKRLAAPGPGAVLALAALAICIAILLMLVQHRERFGSAAGPSSPDLIPLGTVAEVSPPRPVPALHFTDGNAGPMTLETVKGRAVVLNLWATWCVPCRKEMPSLDRLQTRLGGPGFLVLPLSIDRQGARVVAPFYRNLGLTSLGIYLDPTAKAASAVDALGLPTTLLIDTEGREVARVSGAAAWDSPDMIVAISRILHLPAPAPEQQPRRMLNQPEGAN